MLLDSIDKYKGKWIDVFARTRNSDTRGVLQLILRDRTTGDILSEFFEDEIDMWRDNSAGQKASYGFYRGRDESLSLKDESLLLHEICIAKGAGRCSRGL